MAAATVTSAKEKSNYARLCRLLVDVGTQVLRDKFDNIHPPGSLHSALSLHHHATLQSLRKRRIVNSTQWKTLFPTVPSSVSSEEFDITLLMVLLRNICGLTPPATGWDILPAPTDRGVEADIARVKYFRNTIYAHAKAASVVDTTYNVVWLTIRETLVRLGGASYEDVIDNLKTVCLDPVAEDYYKGLLEQWEEDDNKIKDKVEEATEKLEEVLNLNLNLNKKLDDLKKEKEMNQTGQPSQVNKKPKSELPDEPNNVHGHVTQVDDIVEALSNDGSKAVAAVLVSGIPGIGKTTVAIQAGHQLKDKLGCIVKFCSLRCAYSGEERSKDTENNEERELREILSVCVPGHQQTNEFPRHVLLNWCRQLEHELILVLDNAEDAMEEDVGDSFIELLKEMRKCSQSRLKFLITSRRSNIDRATTGLNVKTIILGPLGFEESIEVLKNGAKLQSVSEGQNDKLRQIAELCEHIPLALQLAGPLLSTESEYTVDELIKELQKNPTKTLRCEQMMKIAFEKLHESLRDALVCLSVFVRSFDRNAAKALLGVNYAEYLTKLKDRCLIQKQDDRYLIHLFVRSYARQKGTEKFPQILTHGQQAFLEYFLSLLIRNAKTYWEKDTCKDSFDLFNAERLNYESTLRDVSNKKIRNCRELEDVVNKCRLVAPYIGDCVHIKLYGDFLKGLLHFAQSEGGEVIHRVEILCLLYHEGRKRGGAEKEIQDEAIKLHSDKGHLFEKDGLSEVFYLSYYGRYLSQDCKRRKEAQPILKEALSNHEKEDLASTCDMARILGQMGHNAKELERTEEACEHYLEALKLLKDRYGNHVLTAFAHKDVGDYYLHVEEFPKAEENYQKAIGILEDMQISDHKEAVPIFKNWGICFEKTGMFDESREKYEKGSNIADNTIEGNHKWKVWIKTYLALLLYTKYQEEIHTANRIAQEVLRMGKELEMENWRRKKELEEMYKNH